MVIALFEEFPEPGFAYISKEEDTDRVHELLKDTIDWKKPNSIGPICDWHGKQFLELCKKNVTIKVEITLSQWVLQSSIERPKLEKLFNFKSNSGQDLIVQQLDGQEHPQVIFENWKFKQDHSIHWIRSQCKKGLAYGVFTSSDESTGVFLSAIQFSYCTSF